MRKFESKTGNGEGINNYFRIQNKNLGEKAIKHGMPKDIEKYLDPKMVEDVKNQEAERKAEQIRKALIAIGAAVAVTLAAIGLIKLAKEDGGDMPRSLTNEEYTSMVEGYWFGDSSVEYDEDGASVYLRGDGGVSYYLKGDEEKDGTYTQGTKTRANEEGETTSVSFDLREGEVALTLNGAVMELNSREKKLAADD